MLHKLKGFFKLSSKERILFLEAYIYTGIYRVALLVLSFKFLTRTLAQYSPGEIPPPLSSSQKDKAKMIGKMVEKAASTTPWQSACLVQALSAQKMLRCRNIPAFFALGVKKEKDEMKAHAWTLCDDMIITGKSGHERFTVVSLFGWQVLHDSKQENA